MSLPRGFRTEAERIAKKLRADADLGLSEPLDLRALTKSLDVRIVSAEALVPIERLQEIESIQAYALSACTFEINECPIIVYNPIRSRPRRRSDIAHELAHIILRHDLTEIQFLDGVPFRTCRPDEEQQATTLGGALLLPRPALLKEALNGATVNQVAKKFGVTKQMAQFRWNTTGVARQAAATETARRKRKT